MYGALTPDHTTMTPLRSPIRAHHTTIGLTQPAGGRVLRDAVSATVGGRQAVLSADRMRRA